MTHPTTLATGEIKRALASANRAETMRKSGGDPTMPTTATPARAYDADIEAGPAWVALGNGKHVDGILYRRVKRDVMAQIPSLKIGGILPVKKICSREFWEALDNGEKQQAGRCLALMVSNKEVDLAFVSLNGSGPHLYCKT